MALRKESLLSNSFKVKAERIAGDMRSAIGLSKNAPLCAFKLADHLNIRVRSIQECGLPDNGEKYDDWSAALIYNKNNKPVIVHNKTRSLPRQQSDVMHEISHRHCEHPPCKHPFGLLLPATMLSVNPRHEEEASWLGATLQLPREALAWAIYHERMTLPAIAELYVASQQMVRYRINITGLSKEVQRLHLV